MIRAREGVQGGPAGLRSWRTSSMIRVLMGRTLAIRLLAMTILLAPRVWPAPVDEGTRAAARELGYEGVELFQKGDFAAASERLERAYQVLRVPTIGLWSARALAKLGKLVEASERYLEIGRLELGGEVAVQEQAQRDAARERDDLSKRIPSLIVRLRDADGASAKVTIDGA